MAKIKWTLGIIKQGIDRFLQENGHLPTAWDFDKTDYLPSARQIQRSFGGLEALRKNLGIAETNYTKGLLRSSRSTEGMSRGTAAEDELEMALIAKFGEPFVHTQKRYFKDHRNRYDFFIYYKGGVLGVDIFTTSRAEYIGPNIRHKLSKYASIPDDIPIWFVIVSTLNNADIEKGIASARKLSSKKNINATTLIHFLEYINQLDPLQLPEDTTLVLR